MKLPIICLSKPLPITPFFLSLLGCTSSKKFLDFRSSWTLRTFHPTCYHSIFDWPLTRCSWFHYTSMRNTISYFWWNLRRSNGRKFRTTTNEVVLLLDDGFGILMLKNGYSCCELKGALCLIYSCKCGLHVPLLERVKVHWPGCGCLTCWVWVPCLGRVQFEMLPHTLKIDIVMTINDHGQARCLHPQPLVASSMLDQPHIIRYHVHFSKSNHMKPSCSNLALKLNGMYNSRGVPPWPHDKEMYFGFCLE